MFPFSLFPEPQYVKLVQIRVKLEYKPQDDQKIKTSADKELGHPLLLRRRTWYLGFGQ